MSTQHQYIELRRMDAFSGSSFYKCVRCDRYTGAPSGFTSGQVDDYEKEADQVDSYEKEARDDCDVFLVRGVQES